MIVMSKFLLILLMLASTNTFAAISKWVDAQGQVHYSDQPPPPEAKAETLRSASDTEGTAGTSGVTATSAPPAQKTCAERSAIEKGSTSEARSRRQSRAEAGCC